MRRKTRPPPINPEVKPEPAEESGIVPTEQAGNTESAESNAIQSIENEKSTEHATELPFSHTFLFI